MPAAHDSPDSPVSSCGLARHAPARPRWRERLREAALAAALVAGLAAGSGTLWAAASDPAPDDPAWLQQARKEITARRFDAALAVLQPANAVGNAEWHNLMGYAWRSRTPPDLVAAERHYLRALEIEPRHRSALEYYGELFLMKKDLAGALEIQSRLEKACRFGCPELKDLREAIARYRAAGGK
ncbi:MAG: tetratricopeptide repeat protein [Rubrivivax sp.]